MSEQSDHDRLICIDVKVSELKNQFTNHLQDHKKYMYFAWMTSVGLIVTLITLIIKTV